MDQEEFQFAATAAMVRSILMNPDGYEWSTQGFGFIRTYPHFGDKTWRLNVWHSCTRVEGVSDIHTHPWDFTSIILAGKFQNTRFTEYSDDLTVMFSPSDQYYRAKLIPGIGGGLEKTADLVVLDEHETEYMGPSSVYHQRHDEIHQTTYEDGAVTLNMRVPQGEDVANTYWPTHVNWGDAKPRAATKREIYTSIAAALTLMEQ